MYFKGYLGTRSTSGFWTTSSFFHSGSNNQNAHDVDVFLDFEHFCGKLAIASVNYITNFKRNHIDKDVIVEFLIDTRSTTNILNMETFEKAKEDVRVALNPTK